MTAVKRLDVALQPLALRLVVAFMARLPRRQRRAHSPRVVGPRVAMVAMVATARMVVLVPHQAQVAVVVVVAVAVAVAAAAVALAAANFQAPVQVLTVRSGPTA